MLESIENEHKCSRDTKDVVAVVIARNEENRFLLVSTRGTREQKCKTPDFDALFRNNYWEYFNFSFTKLKYK